ncbi:hypothetical protein JCM8547_001305 [Rhodosporidiobolus lusitaniae]
MASLFSSCCLYRHTPRILSHSRPPLPLSTRPLHISCPHLLPTSSSSSTPPVFSTPTLFPASKGPLPPGLHPYFYAVPRNAIGVQTPSTLAGADMLEDLPEPLVEMEPGEEGKVVMKSKTDPTKIRGRGTDRVGEHSYSCTCPAWAYQKGKAVDVRTCKHLRELLGDEYEDARTGTKAKATKSKAKKTASSSSPAASTSKAAAATPAEKKEYAAPGGKKRAVVPIGKAAKKAKVEAKGKAKKIVQKEEEEEGAKVSDPEEKEEGGDSSPFKQQLREKAAKAEKGRKGGAELLLAKKFDLDGTKDPKGWWVSEKLDGVRAYWDGQSTLWSRIGNPFSAPASFLSHLPRGTTLDGELFLGRDRFDETSGIVRSLESSRWGELRYMVFDIPSMADSPFEERLSALQALFPTAPKEAVLAKSIADKVDAAPLEEASPSSSSVPAAEGDGEKQGEGVVQVLEHTVCGGMEALVKNLQEVQKMGGEGLMLRQPASRYIPKRSTTLLKVKTFYDAEARVVDYEKGKGKYSEMVGSLVCETEDPKKRFSVGSGMTDERRAAPPKIGSIITYRFFELTKAGLPRFPTFVGERDDVTGPKDATVRTKTGGAGGEAE